MCTFQVCAPKLKVGHVLFLFLYCLGHNTNVSVYAFDYFPLINLNQSANSKSGLQNNVNQSTETTLTEKN